MKILQLFSIENVFSQFSIANRNIYYATDFKVNLVNNSSLDQQNKQQLRKENELPEIGVDIFEIKFISVLSLFH